MLPLAPTELDTAGLADTLTVELVEGLPVPQLAEAIGDAVEDRTAEEDAVPSPEALKDVSGLDEALATPVALLAGLVLATTLQDASGVALTLCTGLVEELNVPKLGEAAGVALGDWLSVEETLADPVAL